LENCINCDLSREKNCRWTFTKNELKLRRKPDMCIFPKNSNIESDISKNLIAPIADSTIPSFGIFDFKNTLIDNDK